MFRYPCVARTTLEPQNSFGTFSASDIWRSISFSLASKSISILESDLNKESNDLAEASIDSRLEPFVKARSQSSSACVLTVAMTAINATTAGTRALATLTASSVLLILYVCNFRKWQSVWYFPWDSPMMIAPPPLQMSRYVTLYRLWIPLAI